MFSLFCCNGSYMKEIWPNGRIDLCQCKCGLCKCYKIFSTRHFNNVFTLIPNKINNGVKKINYWYFP